MSAPTKPGRANGGRRRFAPTVAATFGTNVGVAFLSFVNVLITARALGAEGRGTLAFLTTVAMLTATLSSLGVEEASANLVGREPRGRPSLATNALILAVVFGTAAAGLVAVLTGVFPAVRGDAPLGLFALALVSVPFLVFQLYLQFIVRGDYAFGVTNVTWLLAPVVNLLVNGLFLALDRLSVTSALLAWVGGQALSTIVLAWYVQRRLAGFGAPDPTLARRSLGFGLKAHLGRLMKTGNYRLDQWILGSISGSRELGLYSVAVAWSEALFFLPDALVMVMRPDLVRASAREAGSRGAVLLRTALVITAPLVLVLVIAAPILCVTVFGEEFRGAIDDLRLLAPGAFGMVALKLLSNALTAQGRPLLANVGVAAAFCITIGLDLLLIPRHGGSGAAVASTVAYSVGGLVVAVFFARALQVRLRELVPSAGDIPRLAALARTLPLRQR